MTTEQIIVLGFLAAAFLAGWTARALIGGGRRAVVSPAAPSEGAGAQRFEGVVKQSRGELTRAIRAYHAAVVRSLRKGRDSGPAEDTLVALAAALVELSRTVDHASRQLEPGHPLTAKLRGTGVELRRLADDVMRHSRDRELPAGVFDQLEQHLIAAASMIFTSEGPGLQPT